jgi:ribosomal protein S6--L-glutamate ligase
MKIAILSRSPRCYSTRRLREAAIRRGHEAKVFDTLKFAMSLEKEEPDLHYRGRRLHHYDAIIPRIGASITFYGLAVVRQFEQMGVFAANTSLGIAISRDKLRSMQVLSKHDIGMPATCFVRDSQDVMPAIDRIGGVPVILKLLEGTQGVGVILAETHKVAEAIIQTLHHANQNVLIQKFVKESQGCDIRAFVIGDRVVAAMRRRAAIGEFRSNVHRGGSVENVVLPEDYVKTAVRAAQIMGLSIAGVDMLESDDGPKVMEVNSSPGLEGIEKATGIDVADAIVGNIEERVLFPDVDLKQRLRLAAGYGVAEFTVHHLPELTGVKLRDSHLADRNIQVLSIDRGSHLIPNPKGDDAIAEGDKLLCYGELSQLRALMPHQEPQRRRKPRKRAVAK